jgi:hypothetical protein
MSEKLSITIDLSKINKNKIVERRFKNKDGVEVVCKDYKIDVVPLKEPKTIKDGGSWILKKTHFVIEQPTKEERAARNESVYVGEALQFFDKKDSLASEATIDIGTDEVGKDEFPF